MLGMSSNRNARTVASSKSHPCDAVNLHPLTYLREFVRSPRSMGSVCQSSPFLTKRLVTALDKGTHAEVAAFSPRPHISPAAGHVIDLGAGSGCVTEALLLSGQTAESIIAIDSSRHFAAIIRQRFPRVHVMATDAADAMHQLQIIHGTGFASTVISSLPLHNFSEAQATGIMNRIMDSLAPQGVLVQYTYALWNKFPLKKYGFVPVDTSLVWMNFPPARVDIYKCKV